MFILLSFKYNMKKFSYIAILISIIHFVEDAILVALGRYTEVNFLILLIGTISFGLLIAYISRIPSVKKWLSKD